MLTERVALAAAWLLPTLVCNAPTGMLLICPPMALAVTLTLTVQPPAGILVPLARVMLVVPAPAVTAPVQVDTTAGTAATTIWPGALGKVSVNAAASVIALLLGLPKVKVRVEVPLAGITVGEKALLSPTGEDTTSLALVASSLLTPSKVVTPPAGIWLV